MSQPWTCDSKQYNLAQNDALLEVCRAQTVPQLHTSRTRRHTKYHSLSHHVCVCSPRCIQSTGMDLEHVNCFFHSECNSCNSYSERKKKAKHKQEKMKSIWASKFAKSKFPSEAQRKPSCGPDCPRSSYARPADLWNRRCVWNIPKLDGAWGEVVTSRWRNNWKKLKNQLWSATSKRREKKRNKQLS